jgi:hypothetical protein
LGYCAGRIAAKTGSIHGEQQILQCCSTEVPFLALSVGQSVSKPSKLKKHFCRPAPIFQVLDEEISKLNRPMIDHPILHHGYTVSIERLNAAWKYLFPNVGCVRIYKHHAKNFCLAMGTRHDVLGDDLKKATTIFTNWIVAIAAYYGIDTVTYFKYSPETDSCRVNFVEANDRAANDNDSEEEFIYADIVGMPDLEAEYDE